MYQSTFSMGRFGLRLWIIKCQGNQTISLSASIRAGILVVSGVTVVSATIPVDISLALLEVSDRQGVLLFFCYVCVAKILRYTN